MSRQNLESKNLVEEKINLKLDDSEIVKNLLKQSSAPIKPPVKAVLKKGYNMFALASVLQKDLRRGKEPESLFWAVKLEKINPTMLWNRLAVVASEDVGPANPTLSLLIENLRRSYFDAVERRNGSYRVFLTHAVLAIAKSPKSRIVDDLLNVVYGEIEHESLRLQIPDYAWDKHTSVGKKMGRGWDHFFSEGTKLENETKEFVNPYVNEARALLIKYDGLKNGLKKPKKEKSKATKCKDFLDSKGGEKIAPNFKKDKNKTSERQSFENQKPCYNT